MCLFNFHLTFKFNNSIIKHSWKRQKTTKLNRKKKRTTNSMHSATHVTTMTSSTNKISRAKSEKARASARIHYNLMSASLDKRWGLININKLSQERKVRKFQKRHILVCSWRRCIFIRVGERLLSMGVGTNFGLSILLADESLKVCGMLIRVFIVVVEWAYVCYLLK